VRDDKYCEDCYIKLSKKYGYPKIRIIREAEYLLKEPPKKIKKKENSNEKENIKKLE
jgi:hypothetical protein